MTEASLYHRSVVSEANEGAWFKNSRFWVTQAKEVLPPFSWENGLTDRFEILLGEDGGAPEALKAEEFQPMRMALPGHEFRGTFADALRAFTPC